MEEKTGQENDAPVLVVLGSLLESVSDKDNGVQQSALSALRKFSKNYPGDLIHCIINHRHKNSKMNAQDVKKLINLMHYTCEEYLLSIGVAQIEELIGFALEESLKTNEPTSPAADLLTIIGRKYCSQVIDKLSKHIQTGVLPHPCVVYILGNLSNVNVASFLPFLKVVLDFIESVLPHIKNDIQKRIYATAVANMADSLVEYRIENSSAIAKETYSPVIESIYEVFTAQWLQSKDNKLCEAIVRALSPMLLLFSTEKLLADTSRILNTLLPLYKRSPVIPRYLVTVCVGNLLTVAPSASLHSVLDTLLHALHVMVWITPDFSQPLTVRNHSEVLRCYDHIGSLFPEKLCEIILRNLRATSEQDRAVALLVATHLLESSNNILKPRATDLITTLHSLLNENSVKLNKSLVKMIVALAYKEHLTEKDAVLIEFLVKHTFHHGARNGEMEDLESMCNSTIYLLSSTVPAVQPLCWNVLLQLLSNNVYVEATSIVARCLAFIVSKCDSDVAAKSNSYTRPEAVLSRCLFLLGSPLESNRGVPILQFLLYYIPQNLPVDRGVWERKIKQLITYLEMSEWNDNEWEQIMLDAILAAVTEESKNWMKTLVLEISDQLTASQNKLEQTVSAGVSEHDIILDERAILYKFLALFVVDTEDEELVSSVVDKILSPLVHRSAIELKACTRAFGILSRKRMDFALAKLEHVAHTELTRKSSRFLGFLKDAKNEAEIVAARYMVCEYYSQAILEAPPNFLLPRISHFVNWVSSQMTYAAKDAQIHTCCVNIMMSIAEALNKNQDTFEDVLECRASLLSLALSILEGYNTIPDVTLVRIFTTLAKIKPAFQSQDKLQIMQKCFAKLFQYNSSSVQQILEVKNSPDLVLEQLCLMMEEMIDNKSRSILEEVTGFLQPWLNHLKLCQRAASVLLLVTAIRSYIQRTADTSENPNKFSQIGSLFGNVCVRAFEPSESINIPAKKCVTLLFIIIDTNEGNVVTSAEMQHAISSAREMDITKFLKVGCHKFPHNQLPYFVENLISALLDTEESCALGASKLLLILFEETGSILHHYALDMFNTLVSKLVQLPDGEIQGTTAEAIISLGNHHRKMFLTTMLSQPLPLHANVCKCWRMLPHNQNFVQEIIDSLLEIISTHGIYEESPKKHRDRRNVATLLPLTAVSILKEILSSEMMEDFAKLKFSELFTVLLVLVPSYIGVSSPLYTPNKSSFIPNREAYNITPSKVAYDSLLSLLMCVKYEACIGTLNTGTRIELCDSVNQSVLDMIASLARSIGTSSLNELKRILSSLSSYRDSSIEAQRITVTTFCSEVLTLDKIDEHIIDNISTNLLSSLSDASPIVRQISLKGLTFICNLNPTLVSRYYENVLSALLQGLEDDLAPVHAGITVEALNGLSKLLPLLSSNLFSVSYISIAIRIKPYFETEDSAVRSMALRLFGELATHISDSDKQPFMEQVSSNLVCLLLHLAENEESVTKACRFSLIAVSSLLHSNTLNDVIKTRLEDTEILQYTEFLTEFLKIVANDFPVVLHQCLPTSITYSRSIWPEVRGGAALFMGIVCNEVKQLPEGLTKESITSKLLILLKDTEPSVRSKAAYALSLLF